MPVGCMMKRSSIGKFLHSSSEIYLWYKNNLWGYKKKSCNKCYLLIVRYISYFTKMYEKIYFFIQENALVCGYYLVLGDQLVHGD